MGLYSENKVERYLRIEGAISNIYPIQSDTLQQKVQE